MNGLCPDLRKTLVVPVGVHNVFLADVPLRDHRARQVKTEHIPVRRASRFTTNMSKSVTNFTS